MRKYQYNYWDEINKVILSGNPQKEPIVWALVSPGSDYTDVTTTEDILNREIEQKRIRRDYGNVLYEIVASELRLARLSVDPSISAHAAQRTLMYSNFIELQSNIFQGNFISAYEDVNTLTVSMGLTESQIVGYRFILSTFIVSSGSYTDVYGNDVQGAQYDEHVGKSLDVDGYIIEP